MSSKDFGIQKAAILGRFSKETKYSLLWFPEYVEEFPKALTGVPLPFKWECSKFVSTAQSRIPEKHGIYCFSIDLGEPFPSKMHLPLYIGKATTQYLCERFHDYLTEKKNVRGREKVVVMLNKYQNRLLFWWAVLPKVYVDTVEDHLIMCCNPPCNTQIPSREKLWGKAFE